jgi:hypothetical protein
MMFLRKLSKQHSLIGILMLALFTCLVITGCSTLSKSSDRITSIDRRDFDGIWEMESEPNLRIFIYANTFFISDNRMYLSADQFLPGIFLVENDFLTFKTDHNSDMRIKYTAGEDYLLFSEALWLNGRWNKKAGIPEETSTNPLVGTWKGETEEGRILIFQYFESDTGFHYSYNPDFSDVRVCYAFYDIDESTIRSYPVTNLALMDDGVGFQMQFSMQDGELAVELVIDDEFEIVGDELIMKSRSNMVCKRI